MSRLVIEDGVFNELAAQWVSDILDHDRVAQRLDAIRMGGVFRLKSDHVFLQGRVACCEQAVLVFGYQKAPKTQDRIHFTCMQFAENNDVILHRQEQIVSAKTGAYTRSVTGMNRKALVYLQQMKTTLDQKGYARLTVTPFPNGTVCAI